MEIMLHVKPVHMMWSMPGGVGWGEVFNKHCLLKFLVLANLSLLLEKVLDIYLMS